MLKHSDEVRRLFDRMRTWTRNTKVVIVTAKAPIMTQTEIEAANQPRYIDYLGILR